MAWYNRAATKDLDIACSPVIMLKHVFNHQITWRLPEIILIKILNDKVNWCSPETIEK
jgi:hypothetical protein